MGGVKRFPYPKHVWTPVGGWWLKQPNWKGNTFGIVVVFTSACATIAMTSMANERRPLQPRADTWTQHWAKHPPGTDPRKAGAPGAPLDTTGAVAKAWETKQ
eukprot:GFYU01016574.1.p1 GENE.GFYU01016574.1~~GFYU01016574.1.p1  ORF type:complete len:119 (-),score=22.06 GFYU01016574.1:260-565(-)